MSINRKDFIKTTLAGAAALAVGCCPKSEEKSSECCTKCPSPELKLSFQENVSYGETLQEKLDFMESIGVVGIEFGGRGLSGRVEEIQQALKGRNIKTNAICAGFDEFILCEDKSRRDKCISSVKEILAAAGELGSCGMILVPAFNRQTPCMPHTADTRAFLVDQLKELGEFAASHNTSIILEPLNRGEAFYLRQVADAASICRDVDSPGLNCMGDFWHMSHEETSDMGAFFSADKYLKHVHIASLGNRRTPGEDGELDNYIDGFKALKMMNYSGYVSFECGCNGDKKIQQTAAVELLRNQWEMA